MAEIIWFEKEIRSAGLVPVKVRKMDSCQGECFEIDLREPDGSVWAEATHESVEDIQRHLRNWAQRMSRS